MKKLSKKISYAFFDVDGTITKKNTMLPFLNFCFLFYRSKFSIYGLLKISSYIVKRKIFDFKKSREYLNQAYYYNYKNMNVKKISLLGKLWFVRQLNNNPCFFNKKVLLEINRHKKEGRTIVLVSGSFIASLRPMANYLGISEIVCINLEVIKKQYSGIIATPQTIGAGKVAAILNRYADTINFNDSYAYGDHISDIPMLNLVANPCVIGSDCKLVDFAIDKNWKILT